MKKLVTNELSLGLDQKLRDDLIDNFKIIQNGVDGQSDSVNKQIKDMLGDVPLQDQNEVTQARIDANGKQYQTMKTRLDVDQETAETALEEERATGTEVQEARVSNAGSTYPTLKARIDNQEETITNDINEKLLQISAVPEAFSNLAALKAKYPNGKAGIFVTADNGHKYIWNNNQWQDAGVYQSAGISDIEKNDIVSRSVSYNNYVLGGDLSGATSDNFLPYRVANPETSAQFMINTLGHNWVRFSGSKTKYIGGIVDIDVSGSNNYRIWYDTNVKFTVHNNAQDTVPLALIVNAYDASEKLVDSFNPVLNDTRSIKNTLVLFNETKDVSFVLPALPTIFKDTYSKIAKLSLNFVYAESDLDVDFMLTGVSAKLINNRVGSGVKMSPANKMALDNYMLSSNFIKNGKFTVQDDLPIWGNTGTETITWMPNINDKNWANVKSDDVTKSSKGFAFQYLMNTPETRWHADYETIISASVIKRATTPGQLHLGAHVFIYDENNKPIASTYTPVLTRVNTVTLVENQQTIIKFKLPKLGDLINSGTTPAKVVVAFVTDVKTETVDILVTDISVIPENDIYLSTNALTNTQKQQIQAYNERQNYIKGGALNSGDIGAYSIATGKETIAIETLEGDNWLHYTSADTTTAWKGFQVDWRMDGLNAYRLNSPFHLSFEVLNKINSKLSLTISLFDAANKRVGLFTPDVTEIDGRYNVDINIPAPVELTNIGANTPVKVVVAFNDAVAKNMTDFYIRNLTVKPTIIKKIQTKSNLPEIYFTGDVANMTKDISSTLRMDYKFPSGKVARMYSKVTWQGSSSTAYPKKNYKIKLYEDQNLNKKKKFSPFADFRKNSKFVLKANWIDSTHSRNIVNSGLYADITSTRSYIPDGLIGAENFAQIKGHPVNVYINGSYTGLYTLNTTKGSNMYNMEGDKENEIAMEADVWSDATLFKTDSATLEEGKDFDVHAPDVITDTTKTSINRLLAFVNSSSDTDFVNNIHDYIDLPSMIDYFIFANVTQDTDGMGKNASYYTYDGKVWTAVTYDLDSTWGLHWDGASLDPYDQNAISFRGNKLFNRISSSFKEQIKARYKELRATVLRSDVIINKFERFIDEVGKENFDKDQARWTTLPSVNLTDEQQLREAIVKRLQAVDKQIDSL